MKRVFIGIALLVLSARVVADNRSASGRFDLVEATIASIQAAIQNDIITADQLVQMYLARIAAYDAKTTATHLNSYMHVNADAVREAREANKGRANGYQKRPLFGIPVIHPQGQHRYEEDADDRRFRSLRRFDSAVRRVRDEEAPRRRRHHHRQGDDDRVRELPD
jgi:hypothetical protein